MALFTEDERTRLDQGVSDFMFSECDLIDHRLCLEQNPADSVDISQIRT